MEIVHATCIALNGKGVLMRGPSGSGKSDLALRLIDCGALLVADDLVHLFRTAGEVDGQSPSGEGPFLHMRERRSVTAALPSHAEAQRGVMEVRGVGLVRAPHAAEAILHLVIDLGGPAERYPEPETADILRVMIPRLILNPFEASAPAKVTAALEWERLS